MGANGVLALSQGVTGGTVALSFVPLQTPVIALVGNDACWSQISREQVALLGSNVACGLEYLGERCVPCFVPRFGDTRVTPCHPRVG